MRASKAKGNGGKEKKQWSGEGAATLVMQECQEASKQQEFIYVKIC